MFEVKRHEEKPVVVIRAATPHELSNYEKWKIENIEEGAQVNKLETIRIETPSKKEVYASIENKQATIELGELALKDKISAEDIVSEELTDILEPYAKILDVNAELAQKADNTDFEALEDRVDAFLTGTGATDAIDSLRELIEYINTHDDIELTNILKDIQNLENKLVGIDTTVTAYVTAAIEALKIGDYAKAADLATLAERVNVLENKPFDTYATKSEVETVAAKFDSYTTSEGLMVQMTAKADADKVVSNDTFDAFQIANTTAISVAKQEAIDAAKAAEEAKGYAVNADVEVTYATKTALAEAVSNIDTRDTEQDTTIAMVKAIADKGVEDAAKIASDLTLLTAVVNANTDNIDTVDNKINTLNELHNTEVSALEDRAVAIEEDLTALQTVASNHEIALAEHSIKLAALENKDTTIEHDIAGLQAATSEQTLALTEHDIKLTALENKDVALENDIKALQVTASDHTVVLGEQNTRLIALGHKDIELETRIQANADKFVNYYTFTQVDAKVEDVSDTVEALNQRLISHSDANIREITNIIATADNHATSIQQNTDAINTINAELDTYGDIVSHNAIDFDTAGSAFAVEERISETLKKYYTKDEADTEFTTPTEVITEVNNALAEVSSTDSITNITTLVTSVNENTADLKELITEVYGKTEMTGDSRLDLVEGRLDTIEGEAGAKALAQVVKEVVDTNKTIWDKADTAIQTVNAGTDIVATSSEKGTVVVAHKTYTSGTVENATLDSATDPYFITGINITNGHVTDAATRTFEEFFGTVILDCGDIEAKDSIE